MAVFTVSIFVWLNIWLASAENQVGDLFVAKDRVNGQILIEMGEAMNSTLLKLVGNAFVNLENDISKEPCRNNPCEAWTPWSKCSAQWLGMFGFKSRSRACWFGDETCNKTGKRDVETDNVLCEGHCPTAYTFYNSSRLCLRYFKEGVTQDAGENICAKEGGHVLNTDTEERWQQAASIAKEHSKDTLWLDGRRTSIGGKWAYLNGVHPEEGGVSSKWHAGEPSNRTDEFCKVVELQSGSYTWCDRSCAEKYPLICEVRDE